MLRPSLALVTGPGSEPVTLAEAKAWAKIDTSDDDAQVTALITATRQAAEQFLRRSLINQTWKLTLDLSCSGLNNLPEGVYDLPVTALYGSLPSVIPLLKGPVSSITSVVTYDLNNAPSTFGASNYRLDASGERMVLNHGAMWPSNVRPQAGVEITYVAGYGSAATNVPAPIKQGMLIHIATLYEQRGQCGDPNAVPPEVAILYGHYRVLGDRLG